MKKMNFNQMENWRGGEEMVEAGSLNESGTENFLSLSKVPCFYGSILISYTVILPMLLVPVAKLNYNCLTT